MAAVWEMPRRPAQSGHGYLFLTITEGDVTQITLERLSREVE
jgi:hypothetical protein